MGENRPVPKSSNGRKRSVYAGLRAFAVDNFWTVLYCIDHEYLTFLFVVDFYGSFTGKKSPTFNGKESQEHE